MLNLQKDTTNTSSDCMTGYDTLQTTYNQLLTNLQSDASYIEGLQAKGQASGTDAGYMISKIENYIDMATVSTNVFNECNLEYYMQALSKATSNVAGFVSQAINTYYRLQESTVYSEMQTAFVAEDVDTSAALLGTFVKDFLQAEIPDKSAAGFYQEVGSFI